MAQKPKKFEKYTLKGLLSEFSAPSGKAHSFTPSYQPGERRKGIKKDVFDFLSLMNRWGEIIGDKLVEHTYPLKNKNKVLYILTDHPVYAEQLSFMSEILKQKIFALFPSLKGEIHRLQFEQCERRLFEEMRPKIIEEQTVQEKKVPQGLHPQSPLYKKLKQEAEELYIDLKDIELKNLMVSLYIQVKAENLTSTDPE